jgi:hypothetical protein
LVIKVPDLPSAVISCSSYDLLFGMESHSTDSSRMSVNWLLALHPLIEVVEVF